MAYLNIDFDITIFFNLIQMADKTPVPPPTVPEAGPIGVFCPCCNDLRGSLPSQWSLCDACFVAFEEGNQAVQA